MIQAAGRLCCAFGVSGACEYRCVESVDAAFSEGFGGGLFSRMRHNEVPELGGVLVGV